MATLEDLRKKKMEGMLQHNQNLQQQAQEQAQLQQQIEQLEAVIKQFLTKDALARYGTLKTAHPEKAVQLLVILVQAIQSGQIKSQIDDEILKKILQQITPKQREIKIRRI